MEQGQQQNCLIVFFIVHSMSADVAKKGSLGVTKTYRDRVMLKKFPESTPPAMAIDSILQEYGDRPGDGTKGSIIMPHTYVEIRGWKVAPDREEEKTPEEKVEQVDLI